MKYKKKGVTLLELVLYMSISLVISLTAISIFTELRKVYFKSTEESINVNKIVEGFITIDNLAKDKELEKIEMKSNSLKFYYNGNLSYIVKEVIQDNDKLIIRYYIKQGDIYLSYGAPNDIIAEIEGFNVNKKGKLIYITIKKKGELYIKCI